MGKVFHSQWIFSEFSDRPGYLEKPMFGCRAAYLDGRLVMVIAEDSKSKEWNGLLIPTERQYHQDLCRQFPQLEPHKILGKWLFLSSNREEFESVAQNLAECVRRGDPRIGVLPSVKTKPRTRRKK